MTWPASPARSSICRSWLPGTRGPQPGQGDAQPGQVAHLRDGVLRDVEDVQVGEVGHSDRWCPASGVLEAACLGDEFGGQVRPSTGVIDEQAPVRTVRQVRCESDEFAQVVGRTRDPGAVGGPGRAERDFGRLVLQPLADELDRGGEVALFGLQARRKIAILAIASGTGSRAQTASIAANQGPSPSRVPGASRAWP